MIQQEKAMTVGLRRLWLVGVVVLGLCAFAAPAAAEDWPNWRGPDHNGISKETGFATTFPAGGPKILWRASVGTGFSSFAVAGGKAYTIGNADGKDTVFCWDAETGKEIWKHQYPQRLGDKYYEGGTHSTPTVVDGKVYTASKYGRLCCLDAQTGKAIWEKDFPNKEPTWGFASSPLVLGRLVIYNMGPAGLALSKDDGRIVWNSGNEPSGYSTPVPYKHEGRDAVMIFASKACVGVLVETGKPLWSFPWTTRYDVNAADPILQDDKVFISSGYGTGCAQFTIGRGPANQTWRNRDMRNHFNSCILWKGSLYGFDESTFTCMDWETGQVAWTQKHLGKGSLMLAGGILVVLSEDGKLTFVQPDSKAFKLLGQAQVIDRKCWSTPVLANGRVYCRNAKGDVVCVDVKP